MDKIWMKEKIHKCFLLIQARPFLVLILLIVVMSTILRIIAPCLLVMFSLAIATCLALGTGECLGFASRTGEFQFCFSKQKAGSAASNMDVGQNCGAVFDAQVSPCASWKYQFAQSLLQVSRSSLAFAKAHALSDLSEECLFAESGLGYNGQGNAVEDSSTHKGRLTQVKAKNESMNGLDNAELCRNGESTVCKDGSNDMVVADCSMTVADGKVQLSCDNLASTHCEGEVGDVPELEDCGTSSEEEEVCKSVLETTAPPLTSNLNDMALVDAMLQPMNDSKVANNLRGDLNSCRSCPA